MDYETLDSGEREEFDSGMRRDTAKGKPRYDLIPIKMLRRWADLMARGAEKYGDRNWEKANGRLELARFRSSAARHFMQWMNAEQDEDHAAAVLFNIAAYEELRGKIADDGEHEQEGKGCVCGTHKGLGYQGSLWVSSES